MTTHTAAAAATTRYPVARVAADTLFLVCPASAMNASDWLNRQGYDTHAGRVQGQWAVVVTS